MHFQAPAEAYDRFMGRYTRTLAPLFADHAGVRSGQRVLDVGCGPGGLTSVLADRVGDGAVAAIDPAEQFAAACRERVPGADVRVGVAEALPWEDDTFDVALASLVVHFMDDADAGLAEMARVVRPGGTVAACVWDLATGGMTMLRMFWDAVRAEDPTSQGEATRAGTAPGDLVERLRRAGLTDARQATLTATAEYTGFDDFWAPFTSGVGPAGALLAQMPPDAQERIREQCRSQLPDEGPFVLEAAAWSARGVVGPG